jgi:hypothetical protein
MEEEANYFALCLLMPEDQFLEVYMKFPLSPARENISGNNNGGSIESRNVKRKNCNHKRACASAQKKAA